MKGWVDPFKLLAIEDPNGNAIASVLSQAAVRARFSGAAITDRDGSPVIEGAAGEGDRFMLGEKSPEALPERVLADVEKIYSDAHSLIGAARFEWVHDGDKVWIVQLHRGGTTTAAAMLVPGEAAEWTVFKASQGLEELRRFLDTLPDHVGVSIVGQVGLTSHFADLLRRRKRPARITNPSFAAA